MTVMSEIDRTLYRTNLPIREAAKLLGTNVEFVATNTTLTCCSSCNTWLKPKELKPDLDGSPICHICSSWYGD